MGKKISKVASSAGWQTLLLAATCLFPGACASLMVPTPPPNQVRATIEEYGIYTNLVVAGRSEGPAGEWRLTGQEHVRTTTQIPFADGTAFGFRFRLEGEPEPDAIDFAVFLPPEDDGHMPQGTYFRRTAAETRANPFIGYLLESGEPMLFGSYRMFIFHDGIMLCEKQFEVLPPGTEPPPETTP